MFVPTGGGHGEQPLRIKRRATIETTCEYKGLPCRPRYLRLGLGRVAEVLQSTLTLQKAARNRAPLLGRHLAELEQVVVAVVPMK